MGCAQVVSTLCTPHPERAACGVSSPFSFGRRVCRPCGPLAVQACTGLHNGPVRVRCGDIGPARCGRSGWSSGWSGVHSRRPRACTSCAGPSCCWPCGCGAARATFTVCPCLLVPMPSESWADSSWSRWSVRAFASALLGGVPERRATSTDDVAGLVSSQSGTQTKRPLHLPPRGQPHSLATAPVPHVLPRDLEQLGLQHARRGTFRCERPSQQDELLQRRPTLPELQPPHGPPVNPDRLSHLLL